MAGAGLHLQGGEELFVGHDGCVRYVSFAERNN